LLVSRQEEGNAVSGPTGCGAGAALFSRAIRLADPCLARSDRALPKRVVGLLEMEEV
jgi:hypothetical protein